MTEFVKSECDSGVLTVTMARPDKKNAITNAMYGYARAYAMFAFAERRKPDFSRIAG